MARHDIPAPVTASSFSCGCVELWGGWGCIEICAWRRSSLRLMGLCPEH